MATNTSRVVGPLADFRALMVGESRVCRFAADILAGLAVLLIPDESAEGLPLHSLERPAAARRALSDPRAVDAVIVVGSAQRAAEVGLDAESCFRANPNLIYVHVEDEGDAHVTMPFDGRSERSTDPLVAASLGAVLGFSDPGEPRPVELPVSDFATALSLSLGVVASLITAANASGPHVVQLSPSDAYGLLTVDAITQAMVDGDNVTRTSRHPQAQLFVAECACGSGMTVQNSSSQEFWTRFATALGRMDLTGLPQFLTYHDRVRNYFELQKIVCSEMSRRTAAEWEEILEAADVPFSPFLTPARAMAHPQFGALALDDSDCVPSGKSLLRPLRFDGQRPTAHTRSSLS